MKILRFNTLRAGLCALGILGPLVGTFAVSAATCAPAYAQESYKLYLTDGVPKKDKAGNAIISTDLAKMYNITNAFKGKGGTPNVFAVITFQTAEKYPGFKFEIYDSNGKFVDGGDGKTSGEKKLSIGMFIVNDSGTYTIKAFRDNNTDKPIATSTFTVVGLPKPAPIVGTGVLTVCKDTDDDWKPIGASTTWKAGESFNILLTNGGKPFGTLFLGIVIHKQGSDGKDTDFVDERQTEQLGEKSNKYATVGGLMSLPPGVYTIYVINWYNREINVHNGNFKEYYAKTTLTVK
jgi:hypothetical protein